MESLPPLTTDNIASVLQSLLTASTKDTDGTYIDNRARLAYLRQAIKCCELFIEQERFSEIEKRLEHLDGFVSDIKLGMFSTEAAEWIRRRNGVLQN